MLKPPDLIGHASLSLGPGSTGVGVGSGATSAGSGGSGGEIGLKPVMPFQRMKEARARDAHEVIMILPVQDMVKALFPSRLGTLQITDLAIAHIAIVVLIDVLLNRRTPSGPRTLCKSKCIAYIVWTQVHKLCAARAKSGGAGR